MVFTDLRKYAMVRAKRETMEKHALHLPLELTDAPMFTLGFFLIERAFQRIVDF